MIRTLDRVTLKSGEPVRVAALEAPVGRYAGAIRRFLGHKGQPWLTHVELAERGETDALRTTFYVALAGRRILGNVMIVGDGRAGILGHVFTHPDHRRKGIATVLVGAAVGDFRARGGLALSLGTGFESPPWWIYHGHGFRGIERHNGHMLFESRKGDLGRYFAPCDRVRAEDVRWEHWAGIALLYSQPDGDQLRAFAYRAFGPVGFEGGFLRFQTQRERLDARAKVLVTAQGSAVGAAICQRDERWPGNVYTLDLFAHPHFVGQAAALLRGLRPPRRAKIQAYVDRPSRRRTAVLRSAGFRHEATLKRQLLRSGRRVDILVYARQT